MNGKEQHSPWVVRVRHDPRRYTKKMWHENLKKIYQRIKKEHRQFKTWRKLLQRECHFKIERFGRLSAFTWLALMVIMKRQRMKHSWLPSHDIDSACNLKKNSGRPLADCLKEKRLNACRTCSTIICPHWTNHIIYFSRYRCLCRRRLLKSKMIKEDGTKKSCTRSGRAKFCRRFFVPSRLSASAWISEYCDCCDKMSLFSFCLDPKSVGGDHKRKVENKVKVKQSASHLSKHKHHSPTVRLCHFYTGSIFRIWRMSGKLCAMQRTNPHAALQTLGSLVCMQKKRIFWWRPICFYRIQLRVGFCLPRWVWLGDLCLRSSLSPWL